ncbi:MAG TPA: M23 family metallopeptidase [Rhodocyclaceae bacterium]|nr:M23 family metallopeptidase [Rhodocyclaceae bacterium]
MQIIFVSDRLATAKTITITGRHMLISMGALTALIIALSSFFSYITVRHAADIRLPFLQDLLRAVNAEDAERSREFVRDNLSVMAVKLGQMQAQLSRLDSLGDRLAETSGLKPQDIKAVTASKDGRGGPLVSPQTLTAPELEQLVDALSRQLEQRSDAMALIESQVLEERIRRSMLPTTLPIQAAWNASTYGWRLDPFTGQRAMHEGVDFPSPVGTPIYSAAAGVVINVEKHPQYGNLIEIDHGNDITTRYAHTSEVFVQIGTLVKRGQKIAAVGTTGRSTGPHLHFEVRVAGVAQNPNRFLQEAARYAQR